MAPRLAGGTPQPDWTCQPAAARVSECTAQASPSPQPHGPPPAPPEEPATPGPARRTDAPSAPQPPDYALSRDSIRKESTAYASNLCGRDCLGSARGRAAYD